MAQDSMQRLLNQCCALIQDNAETLLAIPDQEKRVYVNNSLEKTLRKLEKVGVRPKKSSSKVHKREFSSQNQLLEHMVKNAVTVISKTDSAAKKVMGSGSSQQVYTILDAMQGIFETSIAFDNSFSNNISLFELMLLKISYGTDIDAELDANYIKHLAYNTKEVVQNQDDLALLKSEYLKAGLVLHEKFSDLEDLSVQMLDDALDNFGITVSLPQIYMAALAHYNVAMGYEEDEDTYSSNMQTGIELIEMLIDEYQNPERNFDLGLRFYDFWGDVSKEFEACQIYGAYFNFLANCTMDQTPYALEKGLKATSYMTILSSFVSNEENFEEAIGLIPYLESAAQINENLGFQTSLEEYSRQFLLDAIKFYNLAGSLNGETYENHIQFIQTDIDFRFDHLDDQDNSDFDDDFDDDDSDDGFAY
ncbi:MAG: hypothetical protein ACMXYK_04560 [Candidatus Woesearchaeota archaeon]